MSEAKTVTAVVTESLRLDLDVYVVCAEVNGKEYCGSGKTSTKAWQALQHTLSKKFGDDIIVVRR